MEGDHRVWLSKFLELGRASACQLFALWSQPVTTTEGRCQPLALICLHRPFKLEALTSLGLQSCILDEQLCGVRLFLVLCPHALPSWSNLALGQ